MPPHVLHCWSYGQGRWRGHHWQWPRARLHQYQHLHPCSGCPRCSGAMTPTCRRRPSALENSVARELHARSPRGFLRRSHSVGCAECDRRKNPRGERSCGVPATVRSKRRRPSAARRRHSVGAPRTPASEHGGQVLVLVKPCPGSLPVMSPLPPLAIGPTVEHMGSTHGEA